MDYRSALAYLDRHTNLEGGRASRFSGPATRPGTPPGGPPMPVAGATEGLSLAPMEALMAALGNPHKAYRTIHITGTNGKGSTARFASALLQATELSVGTYTSPNIETINERLSWDGQPISDDDFGRIIGLLAAVEPLIDLTPSRFELLTAAAFTWFAELGVDVAVVEVGLLGRFDATNVIDSDVAVVTNIGKDHTDGADGWRRAIAAEKAGIVKPSSHLVLGYQPPPAEAALFADEGPQAIWTVGTDFGVDANELAVGGRAIDLTTPGTSYDQLFVPFHGAHQGDNLATAVAAVEAFFGRPLDTELVEQAVATVKLPARFEVVGREPTVILDGAHNPQGASAAVATLREEFARLGSWVLVLGLLGGKDPTEMLESFDADDFDAVICCEPDWTRAVPATDVAAAAARLGISAEVVKSPVEAMLRARAVTAAEDLILIAGSLYVVGEVRSAALTLAAQVEAGT